MEAYREIIDGRKLVDIINIPKKFIDSKIEVIILPLLSEEKNDIKKNNLKKKMNAVSLNTKNYIFDRDEVNAR